MARIILMNVYARLLLVPKVLNINIIDPRNVREVLISKEYILSHR